MPPINLLIKPASGSCNMRCQYCFYADVTENRQVRSYGVMPEETLEVLVKKALEYATGDCTFAFQGGEPTLAGLNFFRKFTALVKQYNTKKVRVHNAIQTNGYLMDGEWAAFLGENKFLVGLSLDGPKDIHDRYRLDHGGKGTYQKVMRAAQLLRNHKVEFNILSVITKQTARHIAKIYSFYNRNGFAYQQYIPCIDDFGAPAGAEEYSLNARDYGRFLTTLFNLWYNDVTKGNFVYNRYFENLVGMVAGYPPESCGMLGHCTNQYVVEADGGVYPCDFYVLDQYRIGNLLEDSFAQIDENRVRSGFIQLSTQVDGQCQACRWKNLCRGGCRRDREPVVDGTLSLNLYCAAFREFFESAAPRLASLAEQVKKGNPPQG